MHSIKFFLVSKSVWVCQISSLLYVSRTKCSRPPRRGPQDKALKTRSPRRALDPQDEKVFNYRASCRICSAVNMSVWIEAADNHRNHRRVSLKLWKESIDCFTKKFLVISSKLETSLNFNDDGTINKNNNRFNGVNNRRRVEELVVGEEEKTDGHLEENNKKQQQVETQRKRTKMNLRFSKQLIETRELWWTEMLRS